MSLESELEKTHKEISGWDWRFRLHARENAACLERSTFRLLDDDQPLLTYRRQPWPTFVGPKKLSQLRHVSCEISRLIRTIPQRIFERDPERIGEFYGFDDVERTRLLLEAPDGFAGAVGRGDFIDTVDGFQCLEFNFGANLGGWETGVLTELFSRIPPVADFIREHRLSPTVTDTLQVLYAHIFDEVERYGIGDGGEVNVAFTSSSTAAVKPRVGFFGQYLDREYGRARDLLGREISGRIHLCDDDDFSERHGRLYHGDARIHAVVETDTLNTTAAVYRAFKAGTTLLYNGPASHLLTSKRNIALLYEYRNDPRFSVEEQQFIQAHVPWTARLLPHYVDYRDERVFLPELVLAERERFVLKDSLSVGGKGVRLGAFTSDAEWAELIEDGLAAGDRLVQQKVESVPYLYQCGDRGCAPHAMIWGPFVFGSRYSGNVLRMQPSVDPGAINLSLTATQGMIYEISVEDEARLQAAAAAAPAELTTLA